MRGLEQNLFDSSFLTTAGQSAQRALADLSSQSPQLAGRTLKWLALRSDINHPENYFTHLQSLPLLALPWWLEIALRGTVDLAFQSDLMYSSMSGYYFTRMLDDLMDGHQVDRSCLPALYPFYLQFQRTYFAYFPLSDGFWPHFERSLLTTAEAASTDSTLDDVTEADFLHYSARKSAAAAIPLAAVCYRYRRPDLLPSWEALFTVFGRWNQMRDDVLDWSEDYQAGTKTWLLCEAERRRAQNESLQMWIGRSGFLWAAEIMERWMQQMLDAANMMQSAALSVYLEQRRLSFRRQIDGMIATAAIYARLLQLDESFQPR